MKRYRLQYVVYIEVEAETYTEAKFAGADLLSDSNVPMEWYFEDCVDETDIEEEKE